MKRMLEIELKKLDIDVQEVVSVLLADMDNSSVDDDYIALKLKSLVSQKTKEERE